MNSIKKTHWLVLLGDYNARRKAWGDSDNGRGKMLEGLATKLGMIRIRPAQGDTWTFHATAKGAERKSICDHALVQEEIAPDVTLRVQHSPIFGSDHSRILLSLDTEEQPEHPARKNHPAPTL